MKVLAIVNARAGAKGGSDSIQLRETLAIAFQQHGIQAEMKVVEGDQIRKTGQLALSEAKQRNIDAVVAGGGDGTIRTVAGLLAGTGVPMGVLPLGTLNHFSKDLGIPAEIEAAVAVIAEGYTRMVDVGEVNNEVFINNSSLGIYPYLVADRERQTSETGRPKWLAAPLAFLRVLRRFPTRRLTVRIGGDAEPIRTPCLFIGNNEYELTPLAIGKREKLDSGNLWLCIASQRDPLHFLWLAFRLIAGIADPAKELMRTQVAAFEITSRASRLPVALDGEVVVMRPPLLYRSRPAGLLVFAPRPSTR